MKNNIVRLFVLSLTVAGFGAASVAAHARTTNKASVAPMGIVGSQSLCAPSDPSACGMQ
ncbi:hypothetical protein GOB94_12195 [Granulicella sp. 5B5]|uniref:hypothetical protein n=1 Tax=Granulicella sp. 5B5 TaxID=1617967 RepID=UPI0015F647F6|nr:hypothetical protein [Granulicella sp. 5B5]QMV19357.1 hypothetical protein GOB94_12195 [Granulicella sp. 5B5]